VLEDEDYPDAMVGLNSGLTSYPTWTEPMYFSALADIPFGVTEYCEQSMESFATGLPGMFAQEASLVGSSDSQIYKALMKKRTHPVTANPFHRPGQRTLPIVVIPNYYNGFAMPVVVKD